MKDRILAILPTKNRRDLFETWARTWIATTEGLSDVIVIVDDDDPVSLGLIPLYPQFTWRVCSPAKPLQHVNRIAVEYCKEYRWLMFMEDDCEFHSMNWESRFIEKLRELGDNGIVYPYDTLNFSPALLTVSMPVMSSNIVSKLGFMAPPKLLYLYGDNFWTRLAKDLGTAHFFQDITIVHNHWSKGIIKEDETARTQREFVDGDRSNYFAYIEDEYPRDLAKLVKRNLVLGGGGFIGGALAAKLKERGEWVRVVDIKPHDYREHTTIADEFIVGDLRDPSVIDQALTNDIDVVYQLAADMGGAGYVFSGLNDADIMHNNATININVLRRAARVKPGAIFFASSACTYPKHIQTDSTHAPLPEGSTYPANPDSEYGWEKLFAERMYMTFARNKGLRVKIARFHNIYGPYGTFDGGKEKVVAAMLRKVTVEDSEIEVWGDGQQARTFLYIDDCLDAIQLLMDHPTFDGPVNMGTTELITMDEVARMAMEIIGKPGLTIKHIEGPVGVRGRCSDNTLVEALLKWSPKISLKDGMTKTYDWLKKFYA